MTLVVAEYECPVHGRFELTVERDANGDAPDAADCPSREGDCNCGHRLAWHLKHPDGQSMCIGERCRCSLMSCSRYSPWVISAPMGRVSPYSMVTGKSDPRPADRHVMDTSVLADGMSPSEFKKERAKVHRDESLRRVRKAFGRGPKTWVGGR